MDECMYSVLLDAENIPGLSKRTISSINKFTSLINGFTRTKDKVSVSNLIQEILESTGYMKELKDSNEIEDISRIDRKSTRLNSSHANISYAVFCLKKNYRTFQAVASDPPTVLTISPPPPFTASPFLQTLGWRNVD